MDPAPRAFVSRLAGVLAVALLLLGSSAPVLDSWLHDTDASAEQAPRHDCTLCRLATVPACPAPELSSIGHVASAPATSAFARDTRLVPRVTDRLTPPSRAPPA